VRFVWPSRRRRADAGRLLVALSVVAGSVAALMGALALAARRGPLAWTSVVVPEMAVSTVVPALLAIALALVARRLLPWRAGPGTALMVGGAALALTGWPLAAWPFAAARSHAAMEAVLGPAYPNDLRTPSGAAPRPSAFSLLDYVGGVAVGAWRLEPDVLYSADLGVELALDLYLPLARGPHPLVVVVHGGGWSVGSRDDRPLLNHYLAGRGYAVAALDYRLAPEARYPAPLQDVRTALGFLARSAEALDVDAQRIVLLGRSAGGHLALLTAYTSTPRMIAEARIAGVVAYYPPSDLVALARLGPGESVLDQRAILRDFLGADGATAAELYWRASPLAYADRPARPTLLVHGARDAVVPAEQSRRLAETLEASGNAVAYVELPWSGHDFDQVFSGLGNQLFLYELDRFLAWAVTQ
jgi:acetyl esterase/lipase